MHVELLVFPSVVDARERVWERERAFKNKNE